MPEPEDGFFQEAMVVNYPSPDVEFTRIVEYKHMPNQPEAVKRGEVKGSLIAREISSAEGDPYYLLTTQYPTPITMSCMKSTARWRRRSQRRPSWAASPRTSTSIWTRPSSTPSRCLTISKRLASSPPSAARRTSARGTAPSEVH